MNAYLNGLAYYVPERKLTNEDINAKFPEWGVDKISIKTGIKKRGYANIGESALDLAVKAVENLFSAYSIEKTSIDFVVYCTQSPEYILPTTACLLQERLNLSTNVGAFDINLGCSGYVYALGICKGLILGGIAKKILLVTSDTYSKFLDPKDKSNVTLFGDGASASIISQEEIGFLIEEFVFGTDGSGAENLIINNKVCEPSQQKEDSFLYMNGSEIFKFTSKNIPILVESVLSKNSISLEKVDKFIFHQANQFMLDFIRKRIQIPEDKFLIDIENYGNTVSTTIPIVIKNQLGADLFCEGDNILLAGFGVGYSWAGCLIKKIK